MLKSGRVKLFAGIDSIGPYGEIFGWLIRWRAERTINGNIRLKETLEPNPNVCGKGIGVKRASLDG